MKNEKGSRTKSAIRGEKAPLSVRSSPFRIFNFSFFISSRGQAMAEYVIIAGLLMASLVILTVFFVTFKEYGGRILALVSSEYP